MATAVRIATFPFRVLGRLVKLLFLPVLIVAVTWLVTGVQSGWFFGVAGFCGLWTFVVVRLWWLQTVGELRSLGRGTVDVRTRSRKQFDLREEERR
ncbi:hypothetical protein [Actinopolyspora halophila]|uniref:hypothetical protein n=1 Tax=Actinopolyspora halophila TaxID=1850 RepID=UPI000372FA7E|nr:hypothetical protein [Actinopolyspora halophila]